MASKQESVSDWMALAKAYDKAEREQGVEPYIIVSLQNRRTGEELYRYDIPRATFWRWNWVIDWRAARLLCQHPKDGINHVLSFYDRKTGLSYGFGSLISSLTSAKANKTIAENKLREYVKSQQGNMFFDVKEDVIASRLQEKVNRYTAKIAELEEEIKDKVTGLKR
jgi:hypothetical protein